MPQFLPKNKKSGSLNRSFFMVTLMP